MYVYRTYQTADEAVKDMDVMNNRGYSCLAAWFNSVDKLVYVTYKRDESEEARFGRECQEASFNHS